MKIKLVVLAITLANYTSAWAQCAPGIPSAGNPGCIPPSQQNSPYHQGSDTNQSNEPPPKWEDRWGAVAMDNTSGRGGTVEGQQSKSKAEAIALDLCKKNGGQNCELLISFHNQCAALTQMPNGGYVNWDTAATTQLAESRALSKCEGHNDCEVIYSKCSFAERVQ